MTLYHFNSRRFGLENLQRRRVKVATIADLNDPFEPLCVDLSDQELRKKMRAWKANLATRYGMLCFSKDWTNPVHWSHYADKHKGICLGFDIPADEDLLMPVTYDEMRSVEEAHQLIHTRKGSTTMMKKFLSTKFHHWHYEKEHRLFVNLKDQDPVTGMYFADFSAQLDLTEVVIGAESDLTREEVKGVLGDLAVGVTVTSARLAFKTFEVVTQQLKRMQK